MATPGENTGSVDRRRGRRAWQLGLILAGLCLLGGAASYFWPRTPRSPTGNDAISRLDRAEELILALTPKLKPLARDLQNLKLPGPEAGGLFAPSFGLVDLASSEPAITEQSATNYQLRLREWHLAPRRAIERESDRAVWSSLLAISEYFERAKFYIIEADLDLHDDRLLHTKMGFDAVAQMKDGHRAWLHGKMHVDWRQSGSDAVASQDIADGWRIVDWQTDELGSTESPDALFFRDTTLAAIDPQVAKAARDSELDQLFLRLVRDKDYRNTDNQDYVVALQWSPGLSVVDVDRDGYDDLYLTKNWGAASFFHNRGDGTFEERAAELGLKYENHCTSALFADFDNDGDDDLFLGRSLRPSLYLENVEGHFVERASLPGGATLPALTYSMCAADYNGDGLLDVYFSTYANRLVSLATTGKEPGQSRQLLASLMGADALQEMLDRAPTRHPVLDRVGPANVLLVNRGEGKFEIAPENAQVQVWRNSFQAAWSDFDEDGDPDLYVVNDYAQKNLLRNDGERGFTDVTDESGVADIGFGMGASWGDYDNDGRLDVYASNMFSKAGRRITSRVEGMDPRFASMARGNSLFRNLGGDKFEKTSGLAPPAMLVEASGWAWSGQFLDVDNDGFQDIHSLAGNITFPDEVAIEVDL